MAVSALRFASAWDSDGAIDRQYMGTRPLFSDTAGVWLWTCGRRNPVVTKISELIADQIRCRLEVPGDDLVRNTILVPLIIRRPTRAFQFVCPSLSCGHQSL